MKNKPLFEIVVLAMTALIASSCSYTSTIPDEDWSGDSATSQKALVIILDTSGSMEGQKMVQAKKALTTYISSLDQDVLCGLVTFGEGDFEIGVPRQEIINHIQEIDPSGSTPLTEAVLSAYKMHEKIRGKSPMREYHIAIITDGVANNCITLGGLVDRIISSRPIHFTTIGIKIVGGNHPLNRSGIKYLEVNDLEGLSEGLQQILVEEPLPQ